MTDSSSDSVSVSLDEASDNSLPILAFFGLPRIGLAVSSHVSLSC